MTNEKKNTNILVAADDDPTAELETLVLQSEAADDESEASATTTGFAQDDQAPLSSKDSVANSTSDDTSQSQTVDRLRFELEVLRAKLQGLSTEVEAREIQANRLHHELSVATRKIQRSEKRIAERDDRIRSLESAIASRDDAYLSLAEELEKAHQEVVGTGPDEGQHRDKVLALQAGQLASAGLDNRELRARLGRIEDYADQLRYQLRLKVTATSNLGSQVESLEQRLEVANAEITSLKNELDEAQDDNAELESKLSTLHATHAEEIRMIRFELGDAQATLSQQELVTEQLASDLVQTRGRREELENQLAKAAEDNLSRISDLEESNQRLRRETAALREKLQTKSEAINCLLAELANSPQSTDSVAEIAEAIPVLDVDEHLFERNEDRGIAERDRVTRLLTGHIDGQKLRFPLFKDRLTIGRTRQNDIQLKAKHVSRRHAVIVIEKDITRLIDWGSKNGVFVNSHRIKEHFLKNGDVVAVGTAEFRYEERQKRDN